jgi:hypothetical protein
MPQLRRFNPDEMRELLREALAQDPEKSLLGRICRTLQNPAELDAEGKRKPHPLWLALSVIALLTVCVFLFFTIESR